MHDVAARSALALPGAIERAGQPGREPDVLGFGRVRHALRRHRAHAQLAKHALPGGGLRQQVREAGRFEVHRLVRRRRRAAVVTGDAVLLHPRLVLRRLVGCGGSLRCRRPRLPWRARRGCGCAGPGMTRAARSRIADARRRACLRPQHRCANPDEGRAHQHFLHRCRAKFIGRSLRPGRPAPRSRPHRLRSSSRPSCRPTEAAPAAAAASDRSDRAPSARARPRSRPHANRASGARCASRCCCLAAAEARAFRPAAAASGCPC